MKAKLVCYSLGKVSATTRRNFHREMYGYIDFSCMGKYRYVREGLLQKTGSRKLMDSVILTANSNAPSIISLLKKYSAKMYVFGVSTKRKL